MPADAAAGSGAGAGATPAAEPILSSPSAGAGAGAGETSREWLDAARWRRAQQALGRVYMCISVLSEGPLYLVLRTM